MFLWQKSNLLRIASLHFFRLLLFVKIYDYTQSFYVLLFIFFQVFYRIQYIYEQPNIVYGASNIDIIMLSRLRQVKRSKSKITTSLNGSWLTLLINIDHNILLNILRTKKQQDDIQEISHIMAWLMELQTSHKNSKPLELQKSKK